MSSTRPRQDSRAAGGGGGGGRYNFEAILRLDLRCRGLKLRRGVPLVGPEVERLWEQQRQQQQYANIEYTSMVYRLPISRFCLYTLNGTWPYSIK